MVRQWWRKRRRRRSIRRFRHSTWVVDRPDMRAWYINEMTKRGAFEKLIGFVGTRKMTKINIPGIFIFDLLNGKRNQIYFHFAPLPLTITIGVKIIYIIYLFKFKSTTGD